MLFANFLCICLAICLPAVLGVPSNQPIPKFGQPQTGPFLMYKINRLSPSQISDILATTQMGNSSPVFLMDPDPSKSNLILVQESAEERWETFLGSIGVVSFTRKGKSTLSKIQTSTPHLQLEAQTPIQQSNNGSRILRDTYADSRCYSNADCSPGRFCSLNYCQGNEAPNISSPCPNYYSWYCQNYGNCFWMPSTRVATCSCQVNTWGERCEFSTISTCGPALNGFCQQGGTCRHDSATSVVSCICPPKTYGQRCEYRGWNPDGR